MLTVKTFIKESPIEGIGLFAGERIPKGTVVWTYNPRFDVSFTQEEVEKMTPEEHDLIMRYAYLSIESGKYIYSIDDGRFMNHSALHPNIEEVKHEGDKETTSVAQRDIEVGEELLEDYRTFDANDAVDTNCEYLKS